MTVRIYIDKPEGVTLEDCSTVSRAIEAVIDADDFIPAPYVLEVSSPGLERPLFSIQDFEKFAGKKAKVKTSEAIDGPGKFQWPNHFGRRLGNSIRRQNERHRPHSVRQSREGEFES